MSLFQLLLASDGDPATNAQGQQAFLFIGDSIMSGSNNSTGKGPTPTSGTAYQWDNVSSVIEIGSNDVVGTPANNGTLIPKFAIDYHAATGKKVVAICRGASGSNYYPDGDNNNWYSTGTLRAAAQSATTATLAAIGTTKLKAIVVGSLGINDARNSEALEPIADVLTAMDQFYAWLLATYPGVPILCVQTGRQPNAAHDSRLYSVRNKLIEIAQANDDVHIVGTMASWVGAGLYGGDNLHGTQTANNFMGAGIARWFSNSIYSKWCRGYLSSIYGDITTSRKSLLNTFFENQVSNGNYSKLEFLGLGVTSLQNDVAVDLSFLGYFLNSVASWVANTHIATSGAAHYAFTYIPSINIARATNSDFTVTAKLKTNNSGSGVVAYLFGGGAGTTNNFRLGQRSTPDVVFQSNSAAARIITSPDTSLQNNTTYGVYRNGTTEGMLKNKVSVSSATTSAVNPTIIPVLGAWNSNGTISNRLAGEYEWIFAAKYSDLNYDSLVDDLNTLVTNW